MSYKRIIAVFALPLALLCFAFRLEIGPPVPSRVETIDRAPFGSSNQELESSPLIVSPDRRHQIHTGQSDQTGFLVIHTDLPIGKTETISLPKEFGSHRPVLAFNGRVYPQLVFSNDSRRILIELFGELMEYDLTEHRFVGSFELTTRPVQVFFDSTGFPKAITGYDMNFGTWQQWDVRSNKKDFDLVRSASMTKQFAQLYGDNPTFAVGQDCFVYCQLGLHLIAVNSLQDGSLIHEFSTAPNQPYALKLSKNDRYLSYSYRGDLPDLSLGRWSIPNAWISRFLSPPGWRLAVIDLHTGASYSGLNGKKDFSGAEDFFYFNEDCTKLVSRTKEARYEYDLPLRGKRLPPEIFAPLVACFVLLPCLLMWRKQRHLSRTKQSLTTSDHQRTG